MSFLGACHCGALRAAFDTALPADQIQVRACQCSFCRRHGARTVSDPEGRLHLTFAPQAAERYRFGSGVTDFLICRECGVYLAAVMEVEGELFGVLNVAGAGIEAFADRAPDPVVYDDEAPAERAQRRLGRWMPATLVEASPSA